MNRLLFLIAFFVTSSGFSQENLKNYLLLGIERAEEITSVYTAPLTEGLVYALAGGWSNVATVNKPWQVTLAIKSNGSFIPEDKLSYTLDLERFENVTVIGDADSIEIPTIVGSTEQSETIVVTIDGREFQFDAPTGTGLLSVNLLPSAFLQAEVGLPYHSEFGVRYFPRITVGDVKFGIIGAGAKHQFSEWIGFLRDSPIAMSTDISFTQLNTDYFFERDGLVPGTNQRIDAQVNSWLFQLSTSTKFKRYNAYVGLGYLTGNSDYVFRGDYRIETPIRVIEYQDPFDVQNTESHWRANIGGMAQFGWFSVNLDYTFQGYNNVSLGLNFDVFTPKEKIENPPDDDR